MQTKRFTPARLAWSAKQEGGASPSTVQPRWNLVIIRSGWRPLVMQKEIRLQRRVDRLESNRCLAEVEAVGEVVVGVRVGEAQRRHVKGLLKEIQNAAEIMRCRGNVRRLGIGRNHDHGNAKAVGVA